MFNGIIQKTGTILKIVKDKNFSELVLKTNYKFKKSDIGSSLCCNGACLTITRVQNNYIFFYLSKETLTRTAFSLAKVGDLINIEKSLNYGNKISGHYVQGHVDSTGQISIIPHTLKLTNLVKLKKNILVNVEFDIFGKYLLNLKK